MKTAIEWKASDSSGANYLGALEIEGAGDPFEVLALPDRLLFGGACNVGFLESGYILREDGESIVETLAELAADLEAYYQYGPSYVSRIVHNNRM